MHERLLRVVPGFTGKSRDRLQKANCDLYSASNELLETQMMSFCQALPEQECIECFFTLVHLHRGIVVIQGQMALRRHGKFVLGLL